ncbi:hypothetical protein [Actinoplanes sp. NPDC051859]|uniref:hypothetical protein n=1 Tax=Actinoplanes sp. NPDC051859 TaxID=3363909 RepID=UPI0037AE8E77
MPALDWRDSVAEGRRLLAQHPVDRWALGDLALALVPPASSRAETSEAQIELTRFADAIGMGINPLKDCYYTAKEWLPEHRIAGISHAKHARYRSRPNRVQLLLNDDLDHQLPLRIRERVEKTEELLADAEVRSAVIERSKERARKVAAAARAIENEELAQARAAARIREQDLRARMVEAELQGKLPERSIRANAALARMVMDLLDLRLGVQQLHSSYLDRTTESVAQVAQAAQDLLEVLRPAQRSTQPTSIIDLDGDG